MVTWTGVGLLAISTVMNVVWTFNAKKKKIWNAFFGVSLLVNIAGVWMIILTY